ncbi:hypothetical protein JL720_6233 [Aureococcus anophagefferens]|nr:hypothetical protein JL720_6233 [Aureococcus anophagefferens]
MRPADVHGRGALLDLALGLDAGRWAPAGVSGARAFDAAAAFPFLAALDPAPARAAARPARPRGARGGAPGPEDPADAATPLARPAKRGAAGLHAVSGRAAPALRRWLPASRRGRPPHSGGSARSIALPSSPLPSRRWRRRCATPSRSSAPQCSAPDCADRDDVADDATCGRRAAGRGPARRRRRRARRAPGSASAPVLGWLAGPGAGGLAHGALEAVVDVVARPRVAAAPRRRVARCGRARRVPGRFPAEEAGDDRDGDGDAAAAAAAAAPPGGGDGDDYGAHLRWRRPRVSRRGRRRSLASSLRQRRSRRCRATSATTPTPPRQARRRRLRRRRPPAVGGALAEVYEVAEHGRSWWRSLCYTSDAGRSLGAPRHLRTTSRTAATAAARPGLAGHACRARRRRPSTEPATLGGRWATLQTHVPDRHLRGLLPDALDAYAFWRNADDAALALRCARRSPSSPSLTARWRGRVVVTRRRVEPGAGGLTTRRRCPTAALTAAWVALRAPQTQFAAGATAPRAPLGAAQLDAAAHVLVWLAPAAGARSPSTPSSSRASASRSGARGAATARRVPGRPRYRRALGAADDMDVLATPRRRRAAAELPVPATPSGATKACSPRRRAAALRRSPPRRPTSSRRPPPPLPTRRAKTLLRLPRCRGEDAAAEAARTVVHLAGLAPGAPPAWGPRDAAGRAASLSAVSAADSSAVARLALSRLRTPTAATTTRRPSRPGTASPRPRRAAPRPRRRAPRRRAGDAGVAACVVALLTGAAAAAARRGAARRLCGGGRRGVRRRRGASSSRGAGRDAAGARGGATRQRAPARHAYDAAALAAEAAMGLTLRGGQAAALAELAGREERAHPSARPRLDFTEGDDQACGGAVPFLPSTPSSPPRRSATSPPRASPCCRAALPRAPRRRAAPGAATAATTTTTTTSPSTTTRCSTRTATLAEAAARLGGAPRRGGGGGDDEGVAPRARAAVAARAVDAAVADGLRRGALQARPHATLVSSAWYAGAPPAPPARQRGPDPTPRRAGRRAPAAPRARDDGARSARGARRPAPAHRPTPAQRVSAASAARRRRGASAGARAAFEGLQEQEAEEEAEEEQAQEREQERRVEAEAEAAPGRDAAERRRR